ncbi:energy-coupling factor transporter ATPase [Texcoconibacillus texcoconensis]|uniref:Energy-coupling factor transport system ATP-binding protein n=1 Tax=Texcoconibacillus texcoconensis TaxID=1095777 RepID=A0A840QQX9_9BACI|nr:energy-coupling factor transport system ATP-binding protein [Texcoconibacillus texcoconensis]
MVQQLEVENLTFQHDQRLNSKTLSNVSFTVQKGEWLAIIGHNGSGKSTLAQLLVGLLVPENGQISADGLIMTEDTKWEIRRKIGLVFQNPENQFIGSTVQDDVAFGLENLNMSYNEMKIRVDEALEMVNMTRFRFHEPTNLSGGQMQRVAIAGALALKPSILLLDEAFVMLDPLSRKDLLETLENLKITEDLTIISITHDVNETAVSDRVLVMESGEVVNSGSPEEIFLAEQAIDPPFAEQLRRDLMAKGRSVPETYMTEREMLGWLCK